MRQNRGYISHVRVQGVTYTITPKKGELLSNVYIKSSGAAGGGWPGGRSVRVHGDAVQLWCRGVCGDRARAFGAAQPGHLEARPWRPAWQRHRGLPQARRQCQGAHRLPTISIWHLLL